MTVTGYWLDAAACVHADSTQFYAPNATGQQKAITTWCAGCPVRAECLADALSMPSHQDFGVRGGLLVDQRRALRQRTDLPTGRDAMTIAALRRLLDEEHPITPQPAAAARAQRPARKEPTVNAPTPPVPATQARTAPIDIADLLVWAENHTEAAVRKHAAAARKALDAIQTRHAASAELARVERAAATLRKQLAELETRAKEIKKGRKTPTAQEVDSPTVAAGKPQRDYDPVVVRRWAREQNVPCPVFGQIPKAVLEAWRGRDAA